MSATTSNATDTELAWDETLARLRAFVARRVDDPETAADITQDVIVRSIAAGALERVDDPVAWLYRSARNAIIDHYRTRRSHVSTDAVAVGAIEADEPDEPNDAARDLSRCLSPLLEQLPETTRDALTRVEIDGRSQAEAAREAGISVPGMKSRVQRGRRALRELLQQCCVVEVDRRGSITDYRPAGQAPGTARACGCDPS